MHGESMNALAHFISGIIEARPRAQDRPSIMPEWFSTFLRKGDIVEAKE